MTAIELSTGTFETTWHEHVQPEAGRRWHRGIVDGIMLVALAFAAPTVNQKMRHVYREHHNQFKPNITPITKDEVARTLARNSMYPAIKHGDVVIPPKPILKVRGAMAIHSVEDAAGKQRYEYIQDPAIVYLPDGEPIAIGAADADSAIPVMQQFILCGPTSGVTFENSILGTSYNGGFEDKQIGNLRTFVERPDNCTYQTDIPRAA